MNCVAKQPRHYDGSGPLRAKACQIHTLPCKWSMNDDDSQEKRPLSVWGGSTKY